MIEGVLIFYGFIFLLWGVKRFVHFFRHRDMVSLLGIFILFSHSGTLIYCGLYFSGYLVYSPHAFGLIIPFLFVLVPGGYKVMHYGTGKKPSWKDIRHAFPLITITTAMVPVWMLPVQVKIDRIVTDSPLVFPYFNFGNTIGIICFLYVLFYFSLEIWPMILNLGWKPLLKSGKANTNIFSVILLIRALAILFTLGLLMGIFLGMPLWISKLAFFAIYSTTMAHALYSVSWPYLLKLKLIHIEFTGGLDFLKRKNQLNPNQINQIQQSLESLLNQNKFFLNENITLDKLADMAGFSSRRLSEFFNNHLHISFSEYLANFRIEEASRLFMETDMSVAEVTYECGFNSSSKFYEHFKKRIGVPPAQFRKKLRKDRNENISGTEITSNP